MYFLLLVSVVRFLFGVLAAVVCMFGERILYSVVACMCNVYMVPTSNDDSNNNCCNINLRRQLKYRPRRYIQYLLRPSYGTDATGGPMLSRHSPTEYSPGMRFGYKIIIVYNMNLYCIHLATPTRLAVFFFITYYFFTVIPASMIFKFRIYHRNIINIILYDTCLVNK